ncbi:MULTISPECIES: DUF6182 family protein [unclassified Streptomyces]|uniref:DUF6182 family protein n=1 Tax=unclassified Streptomyces TaxID=2593676 RepID=UPI004041C7AC
MTLTQQRLRDEAAGRIRTARPDLAARHDLASLDGLLAAQADIAERSAEHEVLAAVVLRRFDLSEWARATCAFALALAPEQAAAWRRSFTRTVFLAGNPDHLHSRFRFAHVSDDRSAAWTGPAPAAQTASLRRLLKLFDGPARLPAGADTTIGIPAHLPGTTRPGTHRVLYLASAECTISDALVHLNHVLVEAVMDGLIKPGDQVTLRQVPCLVGLPARLAAVRVVSENRLPGRLKAAAGLTEETPLA